MADKPTLSVRESQLLILEVMKDVDRFCRQNNIPYTLSSGTMLGAVRHGGFIPWDDDADIFMLRKDFDRFVEIYKSPKYKLSYNIYTPDDYYIAGYAKVVDSDYYSLAKSGKKYPGIFLDIFPLDGVPEDPTLQRKFMHRIMHYENRLYHRQRKDLVSILKSYNHSLQWWKKKFLESTHNKQFIDSQLVGQAVGTTNYRTVLNRNRFESLTDIEFEGCKFLGFSDPHSYLTMVYGEDYMTPKKWSHSLKVYENEE